MMIWIIIRILFLLGLIGIGFWTFKLSTLNSKLKGWIYLGLSVLFVLLVGIDYYEEGTSRIDRKVYLIQAYMIDEESEELTVSYYEDNGEMVTETYSKGEYVYGPSNQLGELVYQNQEWVSGLKWFDVFKLKLKQSFQPYSFSVVINETVEGEENIETESIEKD